MKPQPQKSNFVKKVINFEKPKKIAGIPIGSITISKNNVSWKTAWNDGGGEDHNNLVTYDACRTYNRDTRKVSKTAVWLGCKKITEAYLVKLMPLTYARHVMSLLRKQAVGPGE